MIVDSSALLAIIFAEKDAKSFVDAIEAATFRYVAAPTVLEASIVAQGRAGSRTQQQLDDLIKHLRIEIIDFTAEHAATARVANVAYGKGRGHPAQLNFGDCISYAVSKLEMMPLLFKGNDFRLTDVECAL